MFWPSRLSIRLTLSLSTFRYARLGFEGATCRACTRLPALYIVPHRLIPSELEPPGHARDAAPAPAATVLRLPGPRFCLEERLGDGPHGTTWAGTTADGSRVVAKSVSGPTAPLEAVSGLSDPNLATQVLVAAEDGWWVLTEAGTDVPLSRLPRRLRRGSVVVLGIGILTGLARLHQAGVAHGALKPSNVLVGLDGSVRLTHYGLTPTAGDRDLASARLADVRGAGAMLAALLGLRGEPDAERGSPLERAVHSIAKMRRQHRPGYEATHACVVLWEAAGRLGTLRSRSRSVAQLGELVAAASGAATPARPQMRVTSAAAGSPLPTDQALPTRLSAPSRPGAADNVSLARLLEVSQLSDEQLVAVAHDALEALEAEGDAARTRRLKAADIQITGSGKVRIQDRVRAASEDESESGVEAVGRIVAAGTAASDDPSVVVALEALSIGALGRAPDSARAGLGRSLPLYVSESTLARSRAELGDMVRSAHVTAGWGGRTAPAAAAAAPPTAISAVPAGSSWRSFALLAALCAFAFIATTAPSLLAHGRSRAVGVESAPTAAPVAQPAVASVPASTTPAVPTAAPPAAAPAPPQVAPPAAGSIRAVTLTLDPGCAAGSRCSAQTNLSFAGGSAPTSLSWTVRFYDACGGPPATITTSEFAAPRGWNTVISGSTFIVPGARAGWLVAVTSAPAAAASAAVAVPGAASC